MLQRILQHLWLLCMLIAPLAACSNHVEPDAPHPKREFRAVWVASVHNIDWPSSAGLSVREQKQEFLKILDRVESLNMNAVVVQVRPCGDALYPSKLVQWSSVLTGTQGKAPSPYYDPLDFMIQEAHKRNLEFHAWFNPFRAVSHTRFSSISPNHISKRSPELCFKYGNSLYLDPGRPEARNHVVKVISEVARNYDIDGVHLDDYFYPYPIAGESIPDDATYNRYRTRGASGKEAWRRDNVDRFVSQLHDSLTQIKTHLKFGISPTAVWRNKNKDPRGSDTRLYHAAYDILHADVRKWLQSGWIDYVAPQFYFGIDFPHAPYNNLLNWWTNNTYGRHLYIGQALYKTKEGKYAAWRQPAQLPHQIHLNRQRAKVSGSLFFSYSSFDHNPMKVERQLRDQVYRKPAIVPSMPWKDWIPPHGPEFLRGKILGDKALLNWEAPAPAIDGDTATYYAVYVFPEGSPVRLGDSRYLMGTTRDEHMSFEVPFPGPLQYVVTSLDRLHNESRTYSLFEMGEDRNL
ncbi:MAG: family 10 glycosylhydrolase [Bacteroidota bacterium]